MTSHHKSRAGFAGLAMTLLACGASKPHESAVALPAVSAQPAPVVVSDDVVVASDVVEQTINPAKLPDYHGPIGTVDGTVVTNGAPVSEALTGITGYAGFVVRANAHEVGIAERAAFEPSVVILTYGQTLVVENDSAEARHPMFEQQPHTLSVPARSRIRLHPKVPGRYKLVDGTLTADVYVALTPLHATTDARGHFRIEHVPVGELVVNAVHGERQSRADVEVKANAVTNVTLTLP